MVFLIKNEPQLRSDDTFLRDLETDFDSASKADCVFLKFNFTPQINRTIILKQIIILKNTYCVEHHNVLLHETCLPKTSVLFHSKTKPCQK